MHNLEKAEEIYRQHKEENPHFDHELIKYWKEKMPDTFVTVMFVLEYGCHIHNEEFYEEAVSRLVNPDGSKGAHWSVSTIKSKSGIRFEEKEFTLYDYAYVVNMLYSDYGNVFSDPGYYLRMAKCYLTDGDYFGNPSERAYHNALKRIAYFK